MTDTSIHSDVYCYCLHAASCSLCGKPRTDRSATLDAVSHVQQDPRPPLSNVFGQGPLLLSDIPSSANGHSIVVGIDEAGRGSVLGPMVYGMAYWSVEAEGSQRIPKSFNDSKQLTEDQRDKLWDQILESKDIGFGFKALLPNEISRNMFRHYNLNEQSHDTAMILIRKLLHAGQTKNTNVTIQTCYIDTVGNAGFYQRKLQQEFPTIEFVVESKADAKYAPCSAASVVAKVMRDRLLQGWKFSEPGIADGENNKHYDFGSGYPSDPKCKQWMDDTLQDPVFGYTDLVRFSWAPVKARLAPQPPDGGDTNTTTNNNNKSSGSSSNMVKTVVFAADLDEEEKEQLQSKKTMSMFLQSAATTASTTNSTLTPTNPSSSLANQKRKRSTSSTYFKTRKLQTVLSIV